MNRQYVKLKVNFFIVCMFLGLFMLGAAATYLSPVKAQADAQWNVPAKTILRLSNLKNLGFITGPESANNTQEKWKVGGTDLGVLFGDTQIYMAFGDTFDSINAGNFGGTWRSNVLGIVENSDPAKGLILSSMITAPSNDKLAIQFIEGVKNGDEPGSYGGFQVTTIPTGGFEYNNTLYVTYMSVREWGGPGEWICNYGGFAKSVDNGQTWTKLESLRWPGDSGFVQQSPLKIGDYIYFWSIPSGRFGGVRLMRVHKNSIEQFNEYEYYQGTDANNVRIYQKGNQAMNAAKEIIKAPVGELSVVYNEYIGGYLMTYLNEKASAIQLRYAPQPEGDWSLADDDKKDERKEGNLVSSNQYPALYGAFMHPKLVNEGGKKIYFAMSQFLPTYNVHWMEVEIELRASPTPVATVAITGTPAPTVTNTPAVSAAPTITSIPNTSVSESQSGEDSSVISDSLDTTESTYSDVNDSSQENVSSNDTTTEISTDSEAVLEDNDNRGKGWIFIPIIIIIGLIVTFGWIYRKKFAKNN